MNVTVVQDNPTRWEIEYRTPVKSTKKKQDYSALEREPQKVVCVARTVDDAMTLLRLYLPKVEIRSISPCDRYSYRGEAKLLIDSNMLSDPLTKEEQEAIESFIADDKDSPRATICKLLVRRLGS